jgi:dTDP-4-dehydrorhamnose 3,5-epimerase
MSCPFGEILLVIVNCKKKSKQYLKHTSFKISHKNNTQILIPPNFGNATLCLSNEAVLHYKLHYEGKYNDVSDQQSMKWNDNRLKFKWPKKKFILGKRDK